MTDGNVALITGARRGIGKAIALAMARSGFDIAMTDIVESDELAHTQHEIEALGVRCVSIASDLADIAQHEALFQTVSNTLGEVTCLVNNAGVSVMSRGDILAVSPESFDRCLAVNTRGTFFLMQAFARAAMAASKMGDVSSRSIITITSSNAVAASGQRSEYCVSKAGLSMATTLFSLRLAQVGVAVYEVRPGFIETEMTTPSRERYDALMDGGLTAINRWGQPEEVARTVCTLATGGLPYSVGQAIHVDGGLLVHKY